MRSVKYLIAGMVVAGGAWLGLSDGSAQKLLALVGAGETEVTSTKNDNHADDSHGDGVDPVEDFLAANGPVSDDVISAQRNALADATTGAGFGPQSPRDITVAEGVNPVQFENAPAYSEMNLCNIHFHEGAEHRGGQFTSFSGNGNGKGYGSGYAYDGELTDAELTPVDYEIGSSAKSRLEPGDTIELHYVHTTAEVTPGPTLGSCLNENLANPQLRVEAQVFVLVNDDNAPDFSELMLVEEIEGLHQAINLPDDTGTPVVYSGSTTGPSFNETGSPFQVTWSVRPEVIKVSTRSVANWLAENQFDEDHAHGVRNLVTNPELLSPIQ